MVKLPAEGFGKRANCADDGVGATAEGTPLPTFLIRLLSSSAMK